MNRPRRDDLAIHARLVRLLSSVLELTHALPRRGDDRPHPDASPCLTRPDACCTCTAAAPASWSTSTPSRTRRSCTGARSSPTRASRRCATWPSRPARSASRAAWTSPPAPRSSRRRRAAGSAPPAWKGTATAPRSASGWSSSTCRRTTTARSCRSSTARRGSARSSSCGVGTAGLLHQRITLRNTGDTRYTVQHLHLAFPVPWDATEILDTTGRHLRERSPQRHPFSFGTYLRESRRGRPGADATLAARRRSARVRVRARTRPRRPRRLERQPPARRGAVRVG